MNKLFYIVFNIYYKNGNYKNDIPTLTVGGIFTVFFFCLTLLFYGMAMTIINPNLRSYGVNKPVSFAIGIIMSVIVYFLFFYNKRYMIIYERYCDRPSLNSRTAKVIGLSIIILGLLSPFVYALISNKILLGRWV